MRSSARAPIGPAASPQPRRTVTGGAGALMIEPTETEAPSTLDDFADAMLAIAEEARSDAEKVRTAPHHTAVRRLDETAAARKPRLRWHPPATSE